MLSGIDDVDLKEKWRQFWEGQGIPWEKAPAFPVKRNTIKKFKKLLKQQEEEQAYSLYFIKQFITAL